MRLYSFLVLLVLGGCYYSSDESLVVVKNNSDPESIEQSKKAKSFLPSDVIMEDITIRNGVERLTFSFAVVDSSLMKDYQKFLAEKLKEYGAVELIDNGKGAKIYCLDESETLEIHRPKTKTDYTYDMNDPLENKGFFKLVQLEDEWNFRVFKYRNGYPECANKFS
ncbi:hypothetical protein [Acinetobacter faecalis]|uniref:hypothetical protein n=1 Tax=Acinetobacter faecalis TaxID=2665161 RepID=UPI002A910A2C|nr:hypothetical protein [Acinetobacter faecalis]MDY6449903.1 hypothetical protein [Acinetobacter faecalis]